MEPSALNIVPMMSPCLGWGICSRTSTLLEFSMNRISSK